MSSEEALQRAYYERTAAKYDAMHGPDHEHDWALEKLGHLVRDTGARSVLDVGTGTGRALTVLAARFPELRLHGVDPVPALLERAVANGVPREHLTVGSGTRLPFPDGSFDVVCELGVLHHVPEPAPVVAEMLRVARLGVVLSDNNRFGRGSVAGGLVKLAASRVGLWPLVFRAMHGGKPYVVTEGDGVAYSYSVYDDIGQVAQWAAEVDLLAPAHKTGRIGLLHPLLSSSHVVLVARR